MILKKISLENFLTQEILFSKSIRGNLPFTGELHTADNKSKLQIALYRDHPRIQEILEKAEEKKMLTKSKSYIRSGNGVIRMTFNDDGKLMINNTGDVDIVITELNFNPKEIEFSDFQKGKLAIYIDFDFGEENDNEKLRKEIKDLFTEEQNEG